MTEMEERVARVICERLFGPFDLAEARNAEHSTSGQAVLAARTAIEAMREPSRDMIEAADSEFFEEIWKQMIDAALGDK